MTRSSDETGQAAIQAWIRPLDGCDENTGTASAESDISKQEIKHRQKDVVSDVGNFMMTHGSADVRMVFEMSAAQRTAGPVQQPAMIGIFERVGPY